MALAFDPNQTFVRGINKNKPKQYIYVFFSFSKLIFTMLLFQIKNIQDPDDKLFKFFQKPPLIIGNFFHGLQKKAGFPGKQEQIPTSVSALSRIQSSNFSPAL